MATVIIMWEHWHNNRAVPGVQRKGAPIIKNQQSNYIKICLILLKYINN